MVFGRQSLAATTDPSGIAAYCSSVSHTPPTSGFHGGGGIVETEAQYIAMPEGSVVEDPSGNVYWLTHEGPWLKTGSSNMSGCAELAGTPRTILRVGWSL